MFARLMGVKTVSPDDLHRMTQNREPVSVIDVNSPQSWTKARVPGAINLDAAGYTDSDLPNLPVESGAQAGAPDGTVR